MYALVFSTAATFHVELCQTEVAVVTYPRLFLNMAGFPPT